MAATNENWVRDDINKEWRNAGKREAMKRRQYEKGERFKMIPHPTSPRALIMKPI